MAQSDNATPHQAAVYDQAVRQTIPHYETMHREALDLVRTIQPDVCQWLDTGAGTGYMVELALAQFPRSQFALADPAEAMLERARLRLATSLGARVTILPATPSERIATVYRGLPPQVITAMLCHHYLPPDGRRQAVRACHDVLAEGGLFISFENIAPSTETGVALGLERWMRFQREQGRPADVVEEHRRRYGIKHFPIDVEAHLRLLREVGFAAVELFWFSQMQAGFFAVKGNLCPSQRV